MIANKTVNFAGSHSAIVQTVGAREINAGWVNNSYVSVVGREQGEHFPVAKQFFYPLVDSVPTPLRSSLRQENAVSGRRGGQCYHAGHDQTLVAAPPRR